MSEEVTKYNGMIPTLEKLLDDFLANIGELNHPEWFSNAIEYLQTYVGLYRGIVGEFCANPVLQAKLSEHPEFQRKLTQVSQILEAVTSGSLLVRSAPPPFWGGVGYPTQQIVVQRPYIPPTSRPLAAAPLFTPQGQYNQPLQPQMELPETATAMPDSFKLPLPDFFITHSAFQNIESPGTHLQDQRGRTFLEIVTLLRNILTHVANRVHFEKVNNQIYRYFLTDTLFVLIDCREPLMPGFYFASRHLQVSEFWPKVRFTYNNMHSAVGTLLNRFSDLEKWNELAYCPEYDDQYAAVRDILNLDGWKAGDSPVGIFPAWFSYKKDKL